MMSGATRQAKVEERARRVLVAEDEHLLASNLCADLVALDYQVVGPVSNGRAAVELARQERPDLALLDVRMPQMDGLEAGRQIRDAVDVPLVIISAHSDREHVAASVQLGVLGYLLKPVTRDDLRVTLQVAWAQHLSHCRQRDEVGELERKLVERKLVERAKGLLMQHLSLSEPDAMRRLQKQARDGRTSLAEMAKQVITACEPGGARKNGVTCTVGCAGQPIGGKQDRQVAIPFHCRRP